MSGFDLRRQAGIDEWLRFIGPATARGALFDLGPYPAVVKADGRVRGELYRMRAPDALLARVDAIEGYDPRAPWRSQYVREALPVVTGRDTEVTAWVYLYARGLGPAAWIPDGDYRSHIGRHRRLCYDLGVSAVAARPPEGCA